MSVLIKGIDKPKHCYECPFIKTFWPRHRCEAAIKFVDEYEEETPKWCPIKEVQE
jgi:hypothetical protein